MKSVNWSINLIKCYLPDLTESVFILNVFINQFNLWKKYQAFCYALYNVKLIHFESYDKSKDLSFLTTDQENSNYNPRPQSIKSSII